VDAAVHTQLSEDDLVNSELFCQLLNTGIATALHNYSLEPAIPDPAPERVVRENDPPDPGGSAVTFIYLYLGLCPVLYILVQVYIPCAYTIFDLWVHDSAFWYSYFIFTSSMVYTP
jgi:hypothetical protein